jgi:hypothetical protein
MTKEILWLAVGRLAAQLAPPLIALLLVALVDLQVFDGRAVLEALIDVQHKLCVSLSKPHLPELEGCRSIPVLVKP